MGQEGLLDLVLALCCKDTKRDNSMRGLKVEVDSWAVTYKKLSTHCLCHGGSVNRLGGSRISDLVILGVGQEEQLPLDVIVFIKLQVLYVYFRFNIVSLLFISRRQVWARFSISPFLCYIIVTYNEYCDVLLCHHCFIFNYRKQVKHTITQEVVVLYSIMQRFYCYFYN